MMCNCDVTHKCDVMYLDVGWLTDRERLAIGVEELLPTNDTVGEVLQESFVATSHFAAGEMCVLAESNQLLVGQSRNHLDGLQ